jgi:hypothetical protein
MRGWTSVFLCLVACGGDPAGGGGGGAGTSGPFFSQPMFFNRDVSGASASATSPVILAALRAAGGWGNGDKIQIDFGFDVLRATGDTPMRTFTPTGDFFSPDCDRMEVPVPAAGNLEGEDGYECTTGGDCHLIVFDESAGRLYKI